MSVTSDISHFVDHAGEAKQITYRLVGVASVHR